MTCDRQDMTMPLMLANEMWCTTYIGVKKQEINFGEESAKMMKIGRNNEQVRRRAFHWPTAIV